MRKKRTDMSRVKNYSKQEIWDIWRRSERGKKMIHALTELTGKKHTEIIHILIEGGYLKHGWV